jgi:uncharacterized protein (TIRG00374 family)
MDVDLRTTVVAFVGALVVLVVLGTLVGIDSIIGVLQRVELEVVAVVVLVAMVWLTSWGLSLQTILTILGSRVSARLAVLVFAAATFANNVTPFGQAGGEPLTALFISQAADTEYETGLAAIASVDSVNFIPSIGMALVGISYFSVTVAVGPRLRIAALAVSALALAIPIVGYIGWKHRYAVERRVIGLLTPVIQGIGRLLPRLHPPDPQVIKLRIEGFFHAIERVADDRRRLMTALGFSALGWISLAGSLWLSFYALGYTVPLAAVLVVIPIGAIAGITPLPGGLGGVEAILVALIVPTTGVTVAVATAAVAIHRAATYWLPTLIGGGAAAAFGTDGIVQTLNGGPPGHDNH